MYLDEYQNRGYPIKGFLFKTLIIILFFLIISIFISKIFIKNNTLDSNIPNNELFIDKIPYIKDSVINYYSISKLPSNNSESELMSLSEMINKGIINNIDELNLDKSYVSITKLLDDYLLKIYLNNNEIDDYYLFHLNSYSYCDTYLCPKEDTYELINYGVNAVVPFNENEAPRPVEPAPEALINPNCNIINNKYYDNNGKQVSEVDYIIKCKNPKCEIIDGYYFGKNSKSVSKTNYIKECENTFKCTEFDGTYYNSEGKKVTKKKYLSDCSNLGYQYEYLKKTSYSFSDWTEWSSWERTDCSTEEIKCNNDDQNCIYKLQKMVKKEKTGVYQKNYIKKRYGLVKVGSYKKKACNNYNYLKIDNNIYATPKKSNFESFTILNKDKYNNDWAYIGDTLSKDLENKSITNFYIYKDADFSYCNDTCTNSPNFIYDSFKYIGGIAQVESLTSSSDINGVLLHEIYEESQTNKFSSQCGSYKEKTINIYEFKEITDEASRNEALYTDVCYKSTKTREIIGAGSTRTVWSTLNDEKLLKDGWVMTGKSKNI